MRERVQTGVLADMTSGLLALHHDVARGPADVF